MNLKSSCSQSFNVKLRGNRNASILSVVSRHLLSVSEIKTGEVLSFKF